MAIPVNRFFNFLSVVLEHLDSQSSTESEWQEPLRKSLFFFLSLGKYSIPEDKTKVNREIVNKL